MRTQTRKKADEINLGCKYFTYTQIHRLGLQMRYASLSASVLG